MASHLHTRARLEPGAHQALTLLDLSTDVICKALAYLGPDDDLATALTCRKLRESRARAHAPLKTSVGSLLSSARKLYWGVEQCGAPLSVRFCLFAADLGDLDMLIWLRARGCPWDAKTCSRAALGGHLAMLQWARENGCPWDAWTCSHAAALGRLAVLQWARENGCPWDARTCSRAAEYGHLDVLQWARENGCPEQ